MRRPLLVVVGWLVLAVFGLLGATTARARVAGGTPTSPAWPHGEVIAYKCADSLCLTAPGTGVRWRLLASTRPWPQWDPAFSHDGHQIAFRGYYPARLGRGLRALRGPDERLHRQAADARCGRRSSWSPDGRWIASDTSGYGDIDKVRPNGTGPTKLFSGHGVNEGWYPTWSPDGRWIAFVRDRRHGSQIWLMRPDGSDKHLLHTDATAVDQSLAWSRTGRLMGSTPVPAAACVAATAQGAWVTFPESRLVLRLGRDGRVRERISTAAYCDRDVATRGAIWVTCPAETAGAPVGRHTGTILRISGSRRLRVVARDVLSGTLAAGRAGVFASGVAHDSGTTVRVDAHSASFPSSGNLAIGESSVWVADWRGRDRLASPAKSTYTPVGRSSWRPPG